MSKIAIFQSPLYTTIPE